MDGAAHKGKKLVSVSRWLALFGFGLLVGGTALGIRLRSGSLQMGSAATGLVVLIAAAIVGQVGRAQQGRIV